MNKKRFYKTAAVILTGTMLAGCASNTQAQTYNYDVNADSISMKIGTSYKVKATGSDAAKVKWTSSDQDVATISKEGKVTAVAEGQTIITAKVKKESVDVTLTVLGTKNKQKKDIVVTKDGKTTSMNSEKAVKKDISNYKIKLSKNTYEYDGKVKKPTVTVIAKDGTKLKQNVDYKVSYQANKNVGSAKAIAKGIKKYTGELEYTFKIVAAKVVKETPDTTQDDTDISVSTPDTSSTSTSSSAASSNTSSASTSSSTSSTYRRRPSTSSSSTSSSTTTRKKVAQTTPKKQTTSSSSTATHKSTTSTSSSSTKKATTTTPKKNTNNASSSSNTSNSNANTKSETSASNEGSSNVSEATESTDTTPAAANATAEATE